MCVCVRVLTEVIRRWVVCVCVCALTGVIRRYVCVCGLTGVIRRCVCVRVCVRRKEVAGAVARCELVLQ